MDSEFENYLIGQGHLHFVLERDQAIYIIGPVQLHRILSIELWFVSAHLFSFRGNRELSSCPSRRIRDYGLLCVLCAANPLGHYYQR